ncbi:DMT family transporter [Sporolactobacillus kofuensis]|uniref:DMT family transporter n=1 Tax=Sporolactobacillus kofuensis TaxID=269672 RepID=A0ABW1WC85_9BACL|nr:DMT family transporter [Sporolactobacillus kofuensis]MCO7174971.1 DMT family transporter [Sporolactobacillus kofuensis]
MVIGMMLAFIAGGLVSLQNVFNSRTNEQTGTWAATSLVLGTGFAASLILGLVFEGKNMLTIQYAKPWYWICGLIGIGVVVCLMNSTRLLGPTLAMSIVLTSQLIFALLADSLGILGLKHIPLSFDKLLGVLIIILGALFFKFGGQKHHIKTKPVKEEQVS